MRALSLHVTGIVQGVGFRPFVYNLARERGLFGWVLNASDGVYAVVEGADDVVASFPDAIRELAPPMAVVERVVAEEVEPEGFSAFEIRESRAEEGAMTLVSPDIATCPDCLAELSDPADRRFGYPFINCTNCGPRFTIIGDVPYDRPMTSLRDFPMCPECAAEYGDPADRRFHAQPDACFICGPRLYLNAPGAATDPEGGLDRTSAGSGGAGVPVLRQSSSPSAPAELRAGPPPHPTRTETAETDHRSSPMCVATHEGLVPSAPLPAEWAWEPAVETAPRPHRDRDAEAARSQAILESAAALLLEGRILAIKGLGGFHLACDATNADAVRALRDRKHRWGKPLAVMVPDLDAARAYCHVNEREAELLSGVVRPIVLLRSRRVHCLPTGSPTASRRSA